MSETDRSGDYGTAVEKVIGDGGSTGQSFDRVDRALGEAVAQEQKEFKASASDGRGALTGLAIGAGVLALVAALGAILGVGRRLSEYR
ncbi:hypothetical protein [Streptomyces sp. NPDC059142]|uniref:hypothetical protein n=1 Tax=Streptomyces sp. NPDC059142 TaxID=3346739 RepID=UPI00369919D3